MLQFRLQNIFIQAKNKKLKKNTFLSVKKDRNTTHQQIQPCAEEEKQHAHEGRR